jgi:hypothetical protein
MPMPLANSVRGLRHLLRFPAWPQKITLSDGTLETSLHANGQAQLTMQLQLC